MDPFTIFSLVAGAVALIGSGVSAGVQAKKEEEDRKYNKNLNQTLMDREDNSWQRAVEDRSKAGLSIAGLNSGSGSGGTVSQLQSGSAFGNLSNVLQNVSSNSFGLANSAYERKMQKEIHEDELELKKQQLKNDKLNSRVQRLQTLSQLKVLANQENRDKAIYSHNMKIAKGEETNPLARVYGNQPSEIERLLQALVNNRNAIKEKAEDFLFGESIPQPTEDNVLNSVASASKKTGKKILTIDEFKKHLGPDGQKLWEDGELSSNTIPVKVEKDRNDYYLITSTNKRQHKIRISKSDYDFWLNQLN